MQNRVQREPGGRSNALRRFAAGALVVFAFAGCDVHGISDAGALSSITLTPNPQTLVVGGTQQFTAVGRDFEGARVEIAPVWSVEAGGGTIGSTGFFTAGTAVGSFVGTVKATSGGLSAVATVVVRPGPLAGLVLTPSPTSLPTRATRQFTVVGTDASGNAVAVTPFWSVVAGGGSVSSTGLFTAGTTAGTYPGTVQASSGSLAATATVTVTPGPLATIFVTPDPTTVEVAKTRLFAASGRDADGNVVSVAPTWAVIASGGSIDATGNFTAGSIPGIFSNTVRASSGPVSGTATVTVTTGPLATLTVAPNPTTLAVGLSRQFTATGRDAQGNVVPVSPEWSVVASGGSIGSTGLFTAGTTPGSYANTVRAAVGDVEAHATVVVSAGPLATLTVSPDPARLAIGELETFTVVGRDAGGNVVPVTPAWDVVLGGGSIDPGTGVFTAGNTSGTYPGTVRASVGSLAGFASVVVTNGPVTSITVSPNPVSLLTGTTQRFTALGMDSGGNTFSIAPAWSVVNGGGTIDAGSGVLTAGGTAGTFANTVRATIGTVSGFATINVTAPAPALATITVTPNPVTLIANGAQQFAAIGRDTNGNIFPISPEWTVVAGGGSIDAATGLFTAGPTGGTYANTIRARSGTTSGFATINVTTVPPPAPAVPLGAAAPNGIMAGASVTCISGGLISADVSISPGNTLTGFGPCVITGVTHLADAVAAQGQLDLTSAYDQLAGMPCPPANAIVADLGGTTKPAGVYCTGSGIGVTGTLTLDGGGDPNAVFVFQAGTGLTTAGSVVLINGAQARNVYWQIGTSATLGTASQWQGNILALTSITLVDNATLRGRALARNGSVTLGTNNAIILP